MARLPPLALRFGLDFIQEQVSASKRVLVTCEYGISRSATFVLAYLLEKGYQLPDAWRLLRQQHPRSGPDRVMWESLLEHYRLAYALDEIWAWY